MTSGGQPIDRLRDFLRGLKPEARNLLISEIERGLLRGDEIPGAELILQELRKAIAANDAAPVNVGDAQRLFFEPFAPFLVDDMPERRHRGRISQSAIEPIWTWLIRDLVPVEAKAYSEQVGRLLQADKSAADQLVRAFQDRALQRIEAALVAVNHDDKAQRRLGVQVGIPRAVDELREISSVLKVRDALAVIASRLPLSIRNLADDQLDGVKALLDSPVARHRDIFIYAVLMVRSRLAVSWQLIRLATKAAASDEAGRIAETPFAVAVTIVLGEVERLVARLRIELKSGQAAAVTRLLKEIHDSARALRTELDLSVDSPWARQLTQIRSDVSEILKAAIETAPGRVRRLLGPRARREISAGSELDSIDVDDTEAMIELVSACRNYASELAINEVTLRVHSELQSYLDTGMNPLLDALRHAGDVDRKFRQSQVDAAVRFSGRIFGPSYATLFAKAAEVAAQGERKAAKA
jgi:hypothetical protein